MRIELCGKEGLTAPTYRWQDASAICIRSIITVIPALAVAQAGKKTWKEEPWSIVNPVLSSNTRLTPRECGRSRWGG